MFGHKVWQVHLDLDWNETKGRGLTFDVYTVMEWANGDAMVGWCEEARKSLDRDTHLHEETGAHSSNSS